MRRKNNPLPKLHIKKGDLVKVLSGEDRGKTARVLRTMPSQLRAIVEGINMVTKHMKPNQKNPQGDRVQMEAPLHVSKLQLVNPKTNKPTRIGRKKTDKGWVRVATKKQGANTID